MVRLKIIEDVIDGGYTFDADVDNAVVAIFEHFGGVNPTNARLYLEQVSLDSDITPQQETLAADVERISQLEDVTLYYVVHPEGVGLLVGAFLAVAAVTAVVFLIKSAIPTATMPNTQSRSSNNELAQRTNKPRLLGRIPDIYGEVVSVPDLIQQPYTLYKNHQEVEYAYMCIGRGSYRITDIKDDTTHIRDVAGASVAFYEPYTSPNNGATPSLVVGAPIEEPLHNVRRLNPVNGQTLRPPNSKTLTTTVSRITLKAPNRIVWNHPSNDVDMTEYFDAGEYITLTHSQLPLPPVVEGEPDPVRPDYQGEYRIALVTPKEISLFDPSWTDMTEDVTPQNTSVSATGEYWVGDFVVEDRDATELIMNFVSPSGMYKLGENQHGTNVRIAVEVREITEDDLPTSLLITEQITVRGSSQTRDQRAATLRVALPPSDLRWSVRARRTTPEDKNFEGTVVDDVKWKDLYTSAPVTVPHFGNVTTVQSVTYATTGALALKERRLNVRAGRLLPVRGSEALSPSKNVADIIQAVSLDPFIGARKPEEVDMPAIYAEIDRAAAYFGTPKAVEFSYTFDDTNLSFEETLQAITGAAFSTAYRRGNVLRVRADLPTDDPVLLFNHRNKIPETEVRTVRFGTESDFDGLNYKYVDPEDGALVTLYIPADRSAKKAKDMDSVGVRSHEQAYLHAHREYRRILYQNEMVEFTATQEADVLLPQDKILVADNTRPDTIDGYVVDQQGLRLELSQPFRPKGGLEYLIFIQLPTGRTESINIAATNDPFVVVLSRPPSEILATNVETYAQTSYIITNNSAESYLGRFVVSEKDPQQNMTTNLRCVNFDERVYTKDLTYKG